MNKYFVTAHVILAGDTLRENLTVSLYDMYDLFPYYFQFVTQFSLTQVQGKFCADYRFTFELIFSKN